MIFQILEKFVLPNWTANQFNLTGQVFCHSRSAEPPGEGNEGELHGQVQPQRGGWATGYHQVFPGRLHVGGKHSDQKRDEANSGNATETRKQQANGAGDFAYAREVNHRQGVAKNLWDHASHAVFGFGKMGGAGEQKHRRERPARGSDPCGERGEAESARHAEN